MKLRLGAFIPALVAFCFLVFAFPAKAQNLELINNGDFEAGPRFEAPPWELSGFDRITFDDNNPFIADSPILAHTGIRALILGDAGSIQDAGQFFKIPSDGRRYLLTLFFMINSSEFTKSVHDTFSIEITQKDKRTRVKLLDIFSDADEDDFRNYTPVRFDLTEFAGQDLYLDLSSGNDLSLETFFAIDDVSIVPATTEPIIIGAKVKSGRNKEQLTISGMNFSKARKVIINGEDVTKSITSQKSTEIKLKGFILFLFPGSDNRVSFIDSRGQVSNTFIFKLD